MIAHAWLRRVSLVEMASALSLLGGCIGPFTPYNTIIINPVTTTTFFAPAAIAVGASMKNGPHAIFENESDTSLSVRYWVGKIDCRAPGGVTDWRSPAYFDIAPGQSERVQLGRHFWVTSNSDSVIRVQVSATIPPEATPDQIVLLENGPFWYQFERGVPYKIKATGTRETLAFESAGGAGIKPVDRSLWFPYHNDDFPSWVPPPVSMAFPASGSDSASMAGAAVQGEGGAG